MVRTRSSAAADEITGKRVSFPILISLDCLVCRTGNGVSLDLQPSFISSDSSLTLHHQPHPHSLRQCLRRSDLQAGKARQVWHPTHLLSSPRPHRPWRAGIALLLPAPRPRRFRGTARSKVRGSGRIGSRCICPRLGLLQIGPFARASIPCPASASGISLRTVRRRSSRTAPRTPCLRESCKKKKMQRRRA